jgi:hypothetical protein
VKQVTTSLNVIGLCMVKGVSRVLLRYNEKASAKHS